MLRRFVALEWIRNAYVVATTLSRDKYDWFIVCESCVDCVTIAPVRSTVALQA